MKADVSELEVVDADVQSTRMKMVTRWSHWLWALTNPSITRRLARTLTWTSARTSSSVVALVS